MSQVNDVLNVSLSLIFTSHFNHNYNQIPHKVSHIVTERLITVMAMVLISYIHINCLRMFILILKEISFYNIDDDLIIPLYNFQ